MTTPMRLFFGGSFMFFDLVGKPVDIMSIRRSNAIKSRHRKICTVILRADFGNIRFLRLREIQYPELRC